MTLLTHPSFPQFRPYIHVGAGRGNIDLLDLPDALRTLALSTEVNCVACGAPIKCFRLRQKSKRARISNTPEERRLFYAATCPSPSGCSRTRAAKDHKKSILRTLGGSVVNDIENLFKDVKFNIAFERKFDGKQFAMLFYGPFGTCGGIQTDEAKALDNALSILKRLLMEEVTKVCK